VYGQPDKTAVPPRKDLTRHSFNTKRVKGMPVFPGKEEEHLSKKTRIVPRSVMGARFRRIKKAAFCGFP
jgi:hypothetical protein